jgi:hypothetical protein
VGTGRIERLGPARAAEVLRAGLPGARGRSPLTERLLAGLAGAAERDFDGGTLGRLLATPGPGTSEEARELVLAALHHAALTDPTLAHAAWYPTAVGPAARRAEDGAPAALALAHLAQAEAEVAEFVGRHRLQANDVGRAAALLPGMLAAATLGAPLRLLEVGASAGLILWMDRFRVRYLAGPSWGPRGGPELVSHAEGRVPASLGPPTVEVVERRGVDLLPLDVTDPADELLLRCWTAPDDPDEQQRLHDALAVARARPAPVDAGDLVAWTDQHARPQPGTTTVLVGAQLRRLLDPADASGFDGTVERALRSATREGPLVALLLDPPPGIDPAEHPEVELTVAVADGEGPPRREVLLAADAHGRWVRWY